MSVLHPHVESFRRRDRMQAGSLIMSAFGDGVFPRGGRIWLGSLIRLLAPLGLNERLVRTAVFRLAKEDWLRSEAHGRRSDYALTEAGQRRFQEVSRHIYAGRSPAWDRNWRLILVVGELSSQEREGLRRALFWQGFGTLGTDCHVHPGADLEATLDALDADGLTSLRGRLLPLQATEPGLGGCANDGDLVRRAWNLECLGQAYEEFVGSYQPVMDGLLPAESEQDDENAFLLRLLLIHDFRRLLLRDPELPDVLLPPDWPGQRARQLCRQLYCRLLEASERHLDRHFSLAQGKPTDPAPILATRFGDI